MWWGGGGLRGDAERVRNNFNPMTVSRSADRSAHSYFQNA